jgi:fructokinase
MTAVGPIVGLGELLWDLFPTGRVLGGAPANFAFHCNQLGHPAVVVSRVGDDDLGRDLRATLRGLGLSDEYVPSDPARPTGTVTVAVDPAGQPAYTITEGVAWDALAWTPALDALARSCRAVCFGTLAQRSSGSAETIRQFLDVAGRAGGLRVCDINLRQHYYSAAVVGESLRRSDWLKLNADELPAVASISGVHADEESDLLRQLRERWGLRLVCLTKGADGCRVQTADAEVAVPGERVRVADTVGAGDAFTAGLLAATFEGRLLADAAAFATWLAGRVAASVGATPRIDRAML